MKILWMSWKDRRNPKAGGAEIVNEELAKRLANDGHEVTFLVAGFPDGEDEEIRDGYKIIRLGGRYSVYWHAFRYYKKILREWPDLIIDEVNTLPFFCSLYCKKQNVIIFVHQLCRKVWFYQFFFPLSLIGYLLEPIYLLLINNKKIITVSQSTKSDLLKYGFVPDKINIIPEGIEIDPVIDLENIKKYEYPTLLSLGALRPMKKTLDQIRAFELAKKQLPDLKMKVAGAAMDKYGQRVIKAIETSVHKNDIEYLGRNSQEEKINLLKKCHIISVTSVKEGWGLIVTEAASQGTPAVVYNVDGLRDSVKNGKTGAITSKNTPSELAKNIVELLTNNEKYLNIQKNAWEWSKEFTFQKSYKEFIQCL